MEQQPNFDKIQVDEPMIVEDVVIETLAIDGICGVY